jgi:AmmeMemoRadiSam system protein B
LKNRFSLLSEDEAAHRFEHALEVQLPFLQVLRPDFQFVPITVGTGRFEVLSALGVAIATVIRNSGERVLVIASSDMNHYENDEVTRAKDRRAIEPMLALDPRALHDAVHQSSISMCGYGPAVAMLTASVKLGASKAELIRYATSGDISGDRAKVVGYAGIAVS